RPARAGDAELQRNSARLFGERLRAGEPSLRTLGHRCCSYRWSASGIAVRYHSLHCPALLPATRKIASRVGSNAKIILVVPAAGTDGEKPGLDVRMEDYFPPTLRRY